MSNTSDPPTPKEFHEYLVRLGLEAYDRTLADRPGHAEAYSTTSPDRAGYEAHLRERMADAATVYAAGAEPATPGPAHETAFRRAWAAIPPLVRASAASGALDMLEHQRTCLHEGEKVDLHHGLFRRLEVTKRFVEAYAVLAEFCAALAREADAEAVERGIDADVRPDAAAEAVAVWAAKAKP